MLQDGQWRWEKVQNNTDAWSTLDGNAQVVIENGKFSAKLFAKNSAKDLEISLKGTIRNGKIAAKETILASDYTGSTYHGTIQKKRWENVAGSVGAESITLSDGWSMIGITRAISK